MDLRKLVMVGAFALALAACSSGQPSATGGTSSGAMGGMSSGAMSSGAMGGTPSGSGTSAFGEPGDRSMVDRTIRLTQLDTLRFSPSSVAVKAGQTIRFVVTNGGANDHEFVIGDMAFQDEHEQEMEANGGMTMSDEPNAVSVSPGQTKVVYWRFTSPGAFLYGCHVDGHYAAGMKGEIDVSS